MQKLFEATFKVGKTTFANMAAGIISNKFIAMLLGPVGIGLIAQAKTFLNTGSEISGLGLGTGITKYVAQYKEENNTSALKKVITTAFLSHIFVIAVMLICILLFVERFSFYIFADEKYKWYIILLSLCIPFVTFTFFFTSVLVGYRKIDEYVRAKVRGVFVGLLSTLVLVYFFKLKGGLIQVFIGGIISFLFFVYFYRCCIPRGLLFPKELWSNIFKNWPSFIDKKLYTFSLATFAAVFIVSISLLIVRSRIIHVLGADQNGIYQVAFTMSAYYLPFITNGLWSHFFPEVSSMKSKEDFNREINNTMKFCMLIVTPSICLLLTFKELFIRILFSAKFLPALNLIPVQLVGDFFYVMIYIFNMFLWARAMLVAHLFFVIYYNIFYVAISYMLISRLGIIAVPVAYSVGLFIATLTNFIYHRKIIGFRMDRRNIKISICSLFLIIFIALIPLQKYFIGYIAGILFIIFWSLLVVKKEEFREVLVWTKTLIKKKK